MRKAQEPKLANYYSSMETSNKTKKSLKKGFEKKNAGKKTPTLVPLLLEFIQSLMKQSLRVLKKASLGSRITTVTKKVIIFGLISSTRKTMFKKTSSSLGNLCVSDSD